MLLLQAPATPHNLLIATKTWHTLVGLYFWEYITTLGYEWKVIRGHHKHGLSTWVYSLTRASTLLSLILHLICMNVRTRKNCEVTPKIHFTFTYLAFALASFLLLLRIIAIWNYKKAVVGIAICLWVTNVAFLLQGIIRIHFVWLPANDTRPCALRNLNGIKLSLIVTLTTDILLLITILVGLFRFHRYGSSWFGLQGLLWKQGVAWLILGTLAEVPPVVLVILNLNEDINLLLQFPSMVIISITATRMHRSLVEFATESTEIKCNTVQKDLFPVSVPKEERTSDIAAIQITLEKVEDKHSTAEQYLGLQLSERDLRISMSGQRCVPQNGLAIDHDLENGMDKSVS